MEHLYQDVLHMGNYDNGIFSLFFFQKNYIEKLVLMHGIMRPTVYY